MISSLAHTARPDATVSSAQKAKQVVLRTTSLTSRLQPLLRHRSRPASRQRRALRATRSASAMAQSAAANGSAIAEGLPNAFSDGSLDSYTIGIVGDLHLEPASMGLHEEAREQFARQLAGAGARIVQLGDLCGYSCRPGSRESLEFAERYLAGFDAPRALVTGNHDLEGEDFDTDEANLAAWRQIFRQRHYWAAELGDTLCIGMSTVRFRSNAFSVHEVFIDEEQLAWFEATLQRSAGRPVVVFTHAPPMGSGLQVVQEVHVKNRCAWLNHSSDPAAFIRLVERFPNIRLWFSGHFHLSHNYADSISVVGGCAFVQVGVIGDCNRDGHRHSRLLKGDGKAYELFTLDHEDGSLRLDLAHAWADAAAPQPALHEEELLCDPNSGGWLCSQLACDVPFGDNPLMPRRNTASWFAVGRATALARQAHMLVEYDAATRAPIGLVCRDLEDDEEVVLLDAARRQLSPDGSDSRDGEDVAVIELRRGSGGTARQFERNEQRLWYRIMQQNKWRARLQAQRTAAVV